MKPGLILSITLISAMLALPAMADPAVADHVMNVQAPSLSESKAAEADWYRQFAQPKPADAKPVWQPEPTDDFSVQFGGNARWQLNLDMLTRPNSSPLPREQMQAGATFRVTPRFSVGGEVSVGAERLNDTSQWEDSQLETGIRLKSAFKF
ncbi:NtrZ family periplasmic regulatory protein [Hyphomonas sp.]|uniref:NtrZ family periplasmic regulatory protein n=1 Tax=Hyphomonas sp. TaxID=87 RepID=UPI003569A052